jgi:hypothetical protein
VVGSAYDFGVPGSVHAVFPGEDGLYAAGAEQTGAEKELVAAAERG